MAAAREYFAQINVSEEDIMMREPGELFDVPVVNDGKIWSEAEDDKRAFELSCVELKKLFYEVLELKKANSEDVEEKLRIKQRDVVPHSIILKAVNRSDKYRIKEARDFLQKAKAKVDANHLLVQNLLYEASHLEREIHNCYLFKSQDDDIDLVPEEEFYINGPASITQPDVTSLDSHAKHLARLEWELQERKELQKVCKQLTLNKENVAKAIALKKERLALLPSLLDNLRKATNPLQTALEMEIEKDWEVQRVVKLLPNALYLLYVNLTSNSEASNPEIKIQIKGDEGKALEELMFNDVAIKQKTTAPLTKEARQSTLEDLTKPHPLFITITLTTNEMNINGTLTIWLRYIPKLEIVTASCAAQTDKPAKIKATSNNVISPQNILNALYWNDFGEMFPNPKAKFIIESYGLTQNDCLSRLGTKNIGRPYKWAQKLCGFEFMNLNNISDVPFSQTIIKDSIPQIVKNLINRWITRLELFKQICLIETKKIDTILEEEKLTHLRISCSLVQWVSISWEEYSSHLSLTEKFVVNNSVNKNDIFYRAIITRSSAKLECLVVIPSNYPNEYPIWALCLFWNGVQNSLNSPALKDMEFWTNSLSQKDVKDNKSILIMQLVRTMSSLDIFLETEGPLFDPTEFTQDKNCIKVLGKRTQTKPYQMVDDGNMIVYKQIY